MNDERAAPNVLLHVGDGRRFVVDERVITAAHCLPHQPPAHGALGLEERTYQNLLGPLGERTVWAELLFADPIADLPCCTRRTIRS
jgi:hypothetical protein